MRKKTIWPISSQCPTLLFMSKVVEKIVSQQLNEHLWPGSVTMSPVGLHKYHSTETHTMLRVMSDVLTAADQQCMMPIGLCRPFLAAATTEMHVRLVWDGSALADVMHYRQKSASGILWSAVTDTVSAVRSSAGVWFRPSALRSVHGRPQSSGGKLRPHPASVCWRLSNLHQHASWWRCGGSRLIFPLSWRCRSLFELKSTATEPSQNASLVAGLWVPTAQAQHSRCSSPVNIHQGFRLSTWPGSGHWQWLNDVWPRHCSLSFGLLPAASAMNDCAFIVRRCQENANSVVHVMPTDCCKALLYGIYGGLIQQLQSVQNTAAWLVTGARRCDHITPVLRQLDWLPVKQRIDFKLAVLVYKSLHGFAPPYLSENCQLITEVGRQHLKSSDVHTCTMPRT